MNRKFRRRQFLTGVAAAAAASCLPFKPSSARELLYPPADLSYFETPIPPGPGEIHYGYAAITWGGNDHQAIDDTPALGFPGIRFAPIALRNSAARSPCGICSQDTI